MEFTRTKISGLSGNTEVRFTDTSKDALYPPFTIVADKLGVRFEGRSNPITGMDNLEDLAKLVSESWKEHEALKPKIEIAKVLPGEHA